MSKNDKRSKSSWIRLLPCGGRSGKVSSIGRKVSVERFFRNYFARPVKVTPNGRTAISAILKSLKLKRKDEIYITTTFDKPNVSSCVTSTIFNYCRPSRVLTERTKAIFVIHEFGVPHPDMNKLLAISKKRKIPIIEDCAHTIDSVSNGRMVGMMGKYAICSFPKIFPVHNGGLLVGRGARYNPSPNERQIIREVKRILPRYLSAIKKQSDKKRANFLFLQSKFKKISLRPLYGLKKGVSPSFLFPLVTSRHEKVMEKLLKAKIECGLWHGTNIIVIPMHQLLVHEDLNRIFNAVESVYRQ